MTKGLVEGLVTDTRPAKCDAHLEDQVKRPRQRQGKRDARKREGELVSILKLISG